MSETLTLTDSYEKELELKVNYNLMGEAYLGTVKAGRTTHIFIIKEDDLPVLIAKLEDAQEIVERQRQIKRKDAAGECRCPDCGKKLTDVPVPGYCRRCREAGCGT